MHRRTAVRRIACLAFAMLVASACDPSTEPTDPPGETGVPATLEITPAEASLSEGDTLRIFAVVADSNGAAIEGVAVEWEIDDEAVATMDDSGLVTAVREGEAVITARAGGLSGTATITVLGKIAFVSDRTGTRQIHVMNADGSGIAQLTDAELHGTFSWSPDGGRIAFAKLDGDVVDVYTVAADGSGLTRITNDPYRNMDPVWSPDGSQIAVVNDTSTRFGIIPYGEIHVVAANGSGQSVAITRLENGAFDREPAWSPDGSRIAFYSFRNGEPDIYVVDVDSGDIVGLTDTPTVSDAFPSWSPDGTKITFSSFREGNNWDIYVLNADGSGETRLTSHEARDLTSSWRPRP